MKVRRRVPPLAAAMLLALAPAAPAADTAAVLARIAEAGKGVATLRCRFVQEKRLAMLKAPLVSRGELAVAKPDRLRWEILEPSRSGFAVAGGKGRRWTGTGAAEPFDVRRDPVMGLVTGQLLAWATADTATLARDYAIEVVSGDPVTLSLRPAGAGKGPVERIVVTFSPDLSHVASVELVERDGDSTRIRFTDAAVNGDLPRELF